MMANDDDDDDVFRGITPIVCIYNTWYCLFSCVLQLLLHVIGDDGNDDDDDVFSGITPLNEYMYMLLFV